MFGKGWLVIYNSSQYVHWLCPSFWYHSFSLVDASATCSMIRPPRYGRYILADRINGTGEGKV